MLQSTELKRYSRQIILPELGIPGQEKLKNARALMIGAGGLGCPVLQYLVAAGVGYIGIVDDDTIDISNLHRQVLYSVADIGQKKADVARQKLALLNPYVEINAITERLTAENAAGIFASYDLIIDGSDNFPTRYLVNDTCVALEKPLVFGSVFKFEGQVAVFNFEGGVNYRDLFPEMPDEGEFPNCEEIGVIGVLPGIIGAYMANEAVKIICGIGEPLSGKLLTVNVLDNTTMLFNIRPSAGKANAEKADKNSNPVGETEQPGPGEISLEQLREWQETIPDEIFLVDVREAYEFEEHNIGGVNIPVYELPGQLGQLPTDKKLVFLCQTGQRSKIAVNLVRAHFKGELYSVKGGGEAHIARAR